MHRRIARRLEKAGIGEDARARILEANARALLHRTEALRDEEHFDALHPSRVLLILLDDCGVTDGEVLEAAATIESEHDRLRVPAANALADAVPTPAAGDALAEELVTAEPTVRLIALAERLDHARHLHLRPSAEWRPFHASIGEVYLPVAHRTHARLARRYDWWWRTFGNRFLERTGTH